MRGAENVSQVRHCWRINEVGEGVTNHRTGKKRQMNQTEGKIETSTREMDCIYMVKESKAKIKLKEFFTSVFDSVPFLA
jgi:hypothetical protein